MFLNFKKVSYFLMITFLEIIIKTCLNAVRLMNLMKSQLNDCSAWA